MFEEDQVSMFLLSCQNAEEAIPNYDKQDSLHILIAIIYKVNAENLNDFSAIFYLDVKEPETYKRAMNGSYI